MQIRKQQLPIKVGQLVRMTQPGIVGYWQLAHRVKYFEISPLSKIGWRTAVPEIVGIVLSIHIKNTAFSLTMFDIDTTLNMTVQSLLSMDSFEKGYIQIVQ